MASVAELNKVITSKGYAIKKSFLTDAQVTQLKSELTVAPKVLDKFQRGVESFPIYHESKTRYYLPRHWGKKTFGEPEATVVSEGLALPDTIRFRTTFPPHDFQKEIMATFLEKGANGLICVPCGYGKTFMALNLAVQLKKRFLIIVDKEFLMNQWKAEIENFIEGARVGIVQAAKVQMDAHKYDVTICMIQTICRREFPDGFFDEYGFTIFDECHHLGASYFSKALLKIQTKHMLGLSATPDRGDGLSRVFEYYLGEAVYKNTLRAPDKEAVVKAIWFDSEDPVYKELPVDWRGEVVTAKLLNQVAEFEPRNKQIIEYVAPYILDPDRYLLIISDRISQLEGFHEAIQRQYPACPIGFYIGGMKQKVLDENAATCKILLATYQMTAEGFSVKKLNTIVLTTPRKQVEQASGRIFRERMDERKVAPHIIDVIDSHSMLINRWYVRQRFYKKCQYTIQHINHPKRAKEQSGMPQKDSDPVEDDDDDPKKEEKEENEVCLFKF
jgi:superfamily II DNA or RNA helicase